MYVITVKRTDKRRYVCYVSCRNFPIDYCLCCAQIYNDCRLGYVIRDMIKYCKNEFPNIDKFYIDYIEEYNQKELN